MGAVGVLFAWLSNSQAVLMDGFFSLIGFAAAVAGVWVSARAIREPDYHRPLGYSAEESIFITFRALSLLGLVTFAASSAILTIGTFMAGGEIRRINYEPAIVYFSIICVTCASLALVHWAAWRSTGKSSQVLRLEMEAATFDGLITLAAGVGLGAFPLLKGGPLNWLSPVGDAITVLLLCGLVISRYTNEFLDGLRELAGASVVPERLVKAEDVVRAVLVVEGGRLIDLSVLKFGRKYQIQIYYDPKQSITATQVDMLTQRLDEALANSRMNSECLVLISQHGRDLGNAITTRTMSATAVDEHKD